MKIRTILEYGRRGIKELETVTFEDMVSGRAGGVYEPMQGLVIQMQQGEETKGGLNYDFDFQYEVETEVTSPPIVTGKPYLQK